MSSPAILQTSRLILSEFSKEDAEDLYLLNADPEVLKYTGDPPFESIEDALAFVDGYDNYSTDGFGRWTVRLKSDNSFIGWCGLKRHSNGEVDLGFRIMRKHWGNGYATEAALGCIEYAFKSLDLPYLIGRAMKQNAASHRVLEKVGMLFWKEEAMDLHDALCYRLDQRTFKADGER